MVNMSAKFDEEAHNDLVSIVFTNLFLYMSIVTLNFDLWPPKLILLILSPWSDMILQSDEKSWNYGCGN